ncbi:hypothetical protein [Actinomyces slackii]|nr:hypothetical protein [Actinomyces slackii]
MTLTDAQALSLLAAVAAAPDAPYSDLAAAAVGKITATSVGIDRS